MHSVHKQNMFIIVEEYVIYTRTLSSNVHAHILSELDKVNYSSACNIFNYRVPTLCDKCDEAFPHYYSLSWSVTFQSSHSVM